MLISLIENNTDWGFSGWMCRISDLKYLQCSCHAKFWVFFVNVIQIFVFSGARQLLSRPGNKSGPSDRRWLLHLQGQLRRFLRIQPVGSGRRPGLGPVSWCVNMFFPAPAGGNLLHFVSCSPFKNLTSNWSGFPSEAEIFFQIPPAQSILVMSSLSGRRHHQGWAIIP